MSNTLTLASFIILWPIASIAITMLFAKILSNKQCHFLQTILLSSLFALSIAQFAQYHSQSLLSFGGWPSQIAVNLIIDKLACFMFCLFSFMAFALQIFISQLDEFEDSIVPFYLGMWLLLQGVFGAFCSVDIFNLYVWFEVILLSALTLLCATPNAPYKQIYHYAILNVSGTLIMLLAIALIYANTGSLNVLVIAKQWSHQIDSHIYAAIIVFILGISVKAALFPFYFWLPGSYSSASNSAVLFLSSMTTKVALVVLARLAWYWPPLHAQPLSTLLIALAIVTMFMGVMGAANQSRLRSILSFHIVSQLGYILLCLFIQLPLALIAGLYFLVHNILIKSNLLMVNAIIERQFGRAQLNDLPRLARSNPFINTVFLLSCLSLAGFPPLSGFWGKYLVFKASYQANHLIALCMALIVSLFTLYSMMKIWRFGFCQGDKPPARLKYKINEAAAMITVLIAALLLAFFPDNIMHVFMQVSTELSTAKTLIANGSLKV